MSRPDTDLWPKPIEISDLDLGVCRSIDCIRCSMPFGLDSCLDSCFSPVRVPNSDVGLWNVVVTHESDTSISGSAIPCSRHRSRIRRMPEPSGERGILINLSLYSANGTALLPHHSLQSFNSLR